MICPLRPPINSNMQMTHHWHVREKIGRKVRSNDLRTISDYFYKWRINTDPSKIEVCAFHMYNRQADQELLVQLNGVAVNHIFSFKYQGVTTNHSLIFKKHLENFQKKFRLKINLL